MAAANSSFRVRNGLHVSGNTLIVGNTTIYDNLGVNNAITANGTGHVVKGNTSFGSDTLHVNATNKRAIINASATSIAADTTDWAFEVNGKFKVANNLLVVGTSQFNDNIQIGNVASRKTAVVTGALTAQTTLTVDGNTTISGNSVFIGSGTTPNTVIEGNVWIKGTVKTGATGSYYDLDDLNTAVGSVPILKVYDVSGNQVFP
jgi:hypothetical protein